MLSAWVEEGITAISAVAGGLSAILGGFNHLLENCKPLGEKNVSTSYILETPDAITS